MNIHSHTILSYCHIVLFSHTVYRTTTMSSVNMQYKPDSNDASVHQVNIPADTVLIETERKSWNWCPIVTAVMSLVCCGWVMPMCTLPFAVLSNVFATFAWMEHRTQQYSRSFYHRRAAYAFGITAIVMGAVFLVIMIIMIAVLVQRWKTAIPQH